MSIRLVCDGCDVSLGESGSFQGPAITGQRSNGLGGGGLPAGGFHWCHPCALAAFTAVSKARKARAGLV